MTNQKSAVFQSLDSEVEWFGLRVWFSLYLTQLGTRVLVMTHKGGSAFSTKFRIKYFIVMSVMQNFFLPLSLSVHKVFHTILHRLFADYSGSVYSWDAILINHSLHQ